MSCVGKGLTRGRCDPIVQECPWCRRSRSPGTVYDGEDGSGRFEGAQRVRVIQDLKRRFREFS